MLGRPATRIDLKMEDDLQEYEDFRTQLALQKKFDPNLTGGANSSHASSFQSGFNNSS
jgi:hypothetical protein